MKKPKSAPTKKADGRKVGGTDPAFSFPGFFPASIADLLKSEQWAEHGLYPTVQLLKFFADPYSGPLVMPAYPMPGVGKITIGTTQGCGTLIHRNPFPQPGAPNYQAVLTAGHVIANVAHGQIKVEFPGTNNAFYSVTTVNSFAIANSNQALDYGIVIVSGTQFCTNVIPPVTVTDYHSLSNASKASISGYAAGSYTITSNTNNMLAQQNNPNLIPTNIQTYCGMSGSPVYVMRGNNAYLVGVTFGTSSTSCNGMAVATLLDAGVCNQIDQWLAQYQIPSPFGPQP